MDIAVTDGKVIFGKYKIMFQNSDKLNMMYGLQSGHVCYDNTEKENIESLLQQEKIVYSVIPVTFTQEVIDKVHGRLYINKTEAEDHILYDTEIESERLSNLKKENHQLKQQLVETEDALLTIMFGGM